MSEKIILRNYLGGAVFNSWFTMLIPLEHCLLSVGKEVRLLVKSHHIANVKVIACRNFKSMEMTDFLACTQNGEGGVAKLQKSMLLNFGTIKPTDLLQYCVVKVTSINMEDFKEVMNDFYTGHLENLVTN